MQRWPANHVEIHRDAAAKYGIESGDEVIVQNGNVLTQTGGRYSAQFSAVAYVTDMVPPGVTCGYFNFNQGQLETATNNVTPGQTDPINNRYRFKLGKGTVTKVGESELKGKMSFAPRNIA